MEQVYSYDYDYYPDTAVIEQQRNGFTWSRIPKPLFSQMRNLRFIFLAGNIITPTAYQLFYENLNSMILWYSG